MVVVTVVVAVAMVVWYRHDGMVVALIFTDGCCDTWVMIAPMMSVVIVGMLLVGII